MLNVKPRVGLDWGSIFELDIHHPKKVELLKVNRQQDGSPFIGLRLSTGDSPSDQEVTRYYDHADRDVLRQEIQALQEGLAWVEGQLGVRAAEASGRSEMPAPAHAHHHFVAEAERVFAPPTDGAR